MCSAAYRAFLTSTLRSPTRWTISVGTLTLGSSARVSVSMFIRCRATAAAGLALSRRRVAYQLRKRSSASLEGASFSSSSSQ
jgi:hypothetical protein